MQVDVNQNQLKCPNQNPAFLQIKSIDCFKPFKYKKSIDQYQSSFSLAIQTAFIKGQQQFNPNSRRPLSMYNLLAVLQTIVQSYSHLPINELFQNPLSVIIFLLNNTQIIKDLFKYKLQGFSKAKKQLFLKGGNFPLNSSLQFGSNNQCKRTSSQRQMYVYLAVNHVKLLPLHKYLLQPKSKKDASYIQKHFVENLICITAQNQVIDNILSIEQKGFKETNNKCIKGFIFCIPFEEKGVQIISQQISLFLSISEFFHSHINLGLSVHQVQQYETLDSLIQMAQQDFQEDDDELLSISVYCRIFQALPFKITYSDIATLAQIRIDYWGQTIRIDQGTDGILFWFLLNHSPILINQHASQKTQNSFSPLKVSAGQKNLADKYCLRTTQDQYGHIVFKSKSLIKEPLQNLSFTVVIINIKKPEYFANIEMIFGPIFQAETKKFSQKRLKQRQFQICQKIDQQVDRLSQLLAEIWTVPHVIGSKQQIEESKQNEAKELAYSIKRWLFVKGVV